MVFKLFIFFFSKISCEHINQVRKILLAKMCYLW